MFLSEEEEKTDPMNLNYDLAETADKPHTHILLTSLGLNASENEYELRTKRETARLAPLALIPLLERLGLPKPNRAIAVVTEKVLKAKSWCIFRDGIKSEIGPDCCLPIKISDGSSADDIQEILKQVAEQVPEGADLTLDVTQGLRYLPFIFYALALYLKSLRDVTILGAYYGMVEGGEPDAVKPIVDLQPLLELPEWFHAVRMFRDLGTTTPMVRLAAPLVDNLQKSARCAHRAKPTVAGKEIYEPFNQLNVVVDGLEQHAFSYESGLPLELGLADMRLVASLNNLNSQVLDVLPPLARELTGSIADAAKHSALGGKIGRKGRWKTSIKLDECELQRQARTIDLYVQRRQIPLAVGQMREWVVSWAALQKDMHSKWLDRDTRTRIERRLGALAAFVRKKSATSTDEQKNFGNFWNELTDQFRNVFHHHGMRKEEVKSRALDRVLCFWNDLKNGEVKFPELGGKGGKLLLSPQGSRQGVLFSALKQSEPCNCFVICCAGSADSVDRAVNEAGFSGDCVKFQLCDERAGFDEMDNVADVASDWLLNADEVVANMTGGTTLMRLIVQRLVEDAAKLDRPVRRFALIDRRTRKEQDSLPFVKSECHWLDR